MKRPVDPRKHGKAPKKVYTATKEKDLGNELNLHEITETWNELLIHHSQENHRITSGPIFVAEYHRIFLKYTYEWDNMEYLSEKTAWDQAVAEYEFNLAAWKEVVEAEKKAPPQNIDQKIIRTRQRLANLEAAKAGQPIPFPE